MPEDGYKAPTISEETYNYIMGKKLPLECYEDALRRLLRLLPRVKYRHRKPNPHSHYY